MASLPRAVVEWIARYTVKPSLGAPVRLRRPVLEVLRHASRVPAGVAVARQARGGVFGDLVAPEGAAGLATILYLHGGAYEAASPATHRNVIATLALRSGQAVFAPDYRLSPEHPAPAALEDALAAYEAMLAESQEGVALAGDSAGGGLAVALAVAARDRGLAAPRGLALISPWVDLTMSGASYTANERSDAMLAPGFLERAAGRYSTVLGLEDPVCSPLRADLTGLPPTLIHTGSKEMLLSDAEALAARAEAAGVAVELRVFDGLWHSFHVHAGMLRDADEALEELGDFLRRVLESRFSPGRRGRS
jgi:monoterpene epsilon-lactone hydrolase